MGFIHARLRAELTADCVVIYVTPQTTLSELTSQITQEIDVDGNFTFHFQPQAMLVALMQGKTVILEGLDANPYLLDELQTVLIETPYLIVNGERLELSQFRGQLILTSRPVNEPGFMARCYVVMPAEEAEIVRLLTQRFPDKFNLEDFIKLERLAKIFNTIPISSVPRLYPDSFSLSFSRLLYLYQHNGNWLEAFEEIILPAYQDDPQIAAFMRTMVRLIFGIEEGEPLHSIDGTKLLRVLNQIIPPKTWEDYFWQLADTLSLDLLRNQAVGEDFLTPNCEGVFKIIQEALVHHAESEQNFPEQQSPPSRAAFYRYRFNIPSDRDVSQAAQIVEQPPIDPEERWRQLKESVVRNLQRFGAVFLRGPPGTGKSFMATEVAQEMGYTQGHNVVGPITVGADTTEESLLGALTPIHQTSGELRSQFVEGPIGEWIPANPAGVEGPTNRSPRLFLIDEGNLPHPQFWNFLKGFFAEHPHDRYVWVNGERRWFVEGDCLIMTGNQESQEGRRFQELFNEHVITINFFSFPEDFLRMMLKGYLDPGKLNQERLIQIMWTLHLIFEGFKQGIDFSLRDVQEFALRVNLFLGNEWTKEEVVAIGWKIYRGAFSPTEQLALRYIFGKKLGVDAEELFTKEVKAVVEAKGESYLASPYRITVVDSVAEMVITVSDFHRIRRERMARRARGERSLAGKRGLIFEGPPGRGKDVLILQVHEDEGFSAGNLNQTYSEEEAIHLYYRLSYSDEIELIIQTIERAKTQGSIVYFRRDEPFAIGISGRPVKRCPDWSSPRRLCPFCHHEFAGFWQPPAALGCPLESYYL